ncbi:MAG TPA: nuclear transport factor 2 family protein [Mycobacteriales bacterium]|nr:nuclear transport factor 2 family protein [Mycobacteriales bacterium]
MVDRAELEQFWARWLAANAAAEQAEDWSGLGAFFAQDATYGWNSGPDDNFMAVGREEIRELAIGLEMQGLGGWTYPYQVTVMDDRQNMVLGLWKQVADVRRPDGGTYEVAGFGCSWFGYRDGAWAWQRDFFDHGNAGAVFMEMMAAGVLSAGMTARLESAMKGVRPPGHYRTRDLPAPLWPTPPG